MRQVEVSEERLEMTKVPSGKCPQLILELEENERVVHAEFVLWPSKPGDGDTYHCKVIIEKVLNEGGKT